MISSVGTKTYTDAQVTEAAGLHVDNLRRLITWRALVPVQAGGGRGRVRLWTTRQALRISVTAQFVEAGFTLQMAHTLTYCLPLDDLLNTFDPDILNGLLGGKTGEGLDWSRARYKEISTDPNFDGWPGEQYYGTQTLIADGRYLYSDVIDPQPHLLAIIDPERQRVFPSYSPSDFIHGTGMTEMYGLPWRLDAEDIDKTTLLIDRGFMRKRNKKHHKAFDALLPDALPKYLNSVDDLVCRFYLSLNLAFGMVVCIRRLSGMPVPTRPVEVLARRNA